MTHKKKKISLPAALRKEGWILLFLLSIVVFVGYYFIYTKVLSLKTPRQMYLEDKHERLSATIDLMQARISEVEKKLTTLSERDQNVYRTIFGMTYLHDLKLNNGVDSNRIDRIIDNLYKVAYNQSISFDTIAPLAENINKMALRVPSIPPVNMSKIHISSPFGVRSDPFEGNAKVHMGIDLAGPMGEPVYATGDGKVIEVNVNFFGYGNEVIIDHGFGYKTRYAHLKNYVVHQGQFIKRGDQIGTMGTSGKSTGSHLHYEVIYMEMRVNPINFFNAKMSESEYERLVTQK